MPLQLQFAQQGGLPAQAFNLEPPTDCPQCHIGIVAIPVGNTGYIWGPANGRLAMYMFACPREVCRSGFIAIWANDIPTQQWFLRGLYPSTIQPSVRSRFIEGVSGSFYTIFDQAREAEHDQLTEIAGMGYRKALEFLIKDYLISKTTDDARREQIKRKMLGPCIADDVADDRIKNVARRAAWLGNDETHYVRRWEDRDIEDLKRLIELTVRWIEMELETEEALAAMPEA
jgi:hypothetical protein